MQGIAGRVQCAQSAFFIANDMFANNLTELQSADTGPTETGFVDQFVFANTTYDYGGWEVTRVMINNTSAHVRLYVVYAFEWQGGSAFAIFRTTTNELTDTSIGYPSFSSSTGQTSGTRLVISLTSWFIAVLNDVQRYCDWCC